MLEIDHTREGTASNPVSPGVVNRAQSILRALIRFDAAPVTEVEDASRDALRSQSDATGVTDKAIQRSNYRRKAL